MIGVRFGKKGFWRYQNLISILNRKQILINIVIVSLKQNEYSVRFWEVQKHFKTIEHEAKAAEDLGELEQAVKLYEQMVAERILYAITI